MDNGHSAQSERVPSSPRLPSGYQGLPLQGPVPGDWPDYHSRPMLIRRACPHTPTSTVGSTGHGPLPSGNAGIVRAGDQARRASQLAR